MFIEILLVMGLVAVLNHLGIVDFTSFTGIALTLLTVLTGFAFFLLVARILSVWAADHMFGLSSWTASRAPIVGRDIPPRLPPNPTLDLLRKRVEKWPNDLGASRDLADALARQNHHHLAIQERRRFLQQNRKNLEAATLATIMYRIADSLVAIKQTSQAVEALKEIGQAFPQSREAEIAAERIQYLLDNANSAGTDTPQV
jgi:hypothetical protein